MELEEWKLKSDLQIEPFLLITLLSNKIQEINDGRLPNLGDVPCRIFIKNAEERADMNNCIKNKQAIFQYELVLPV